MSNQERTFVAGGKSHTLRFTQNALYKLERELGRPLRIALQNLGVVELQAMLWAGLEGARLKRTSSGEPYTIEFAGDLIDELGGAAAALPIVMDAWRAAMPAREQAEQDRSAPDPTQD